MKCIFCKNPSSRSISVEHIVPESLGNSKHILPAGIVCDKCNNYFARKVEKPLLESQYFTHARFRNAIPNKKGRIPPLEIVYGPSNTELGLRVVRDGTTEIYPLSHKDDLRFTEYLETHDSAHFFIPEATPTDTHLVSRFLAKAALEIVTHKVMETPGWEDAVVFRKELDEVRFFARYGVKGKKWPYYERRIYSEQHVFTSDTGEDYEILHEFDTLYTKRRELYAILVIFGVEYTINLGGPEIEGYTKWLEENNYRSHLYPLLGT